LRRGRAVGPPAPPGGAGISAQGRCATGVEHRLAGPVQQAGYEGAGAEDRRGPPEHGGVAVDRGELRADCPGSVVGDRVLHRGGERRAQESGADRATDLLERIHRGRCDARVCVGGTDRAAGEGGGEEDGTLAVHVRDDGIGGAGPDGSRLLGLADRLAALDGELRVEGPTDGGTLITAAIPIGGSSPELRG
jgi:hypothetical protein